MSVLVEEKILQDEVYINSVHITEELKENI